jgi:putative colanic acid biosynthesis acetyltransferase WcaF
MTVDLSKTRAAGYAPGRSFLLRTVWLFVEAVVFSNPIVVSYRMKAALLRLFGAHVGHGVVLKPSIHVKYPWRLSIGDNTWIGERAWLDNMENIHIGSNVVVSQGAYLCTGNHDWSDSGMPLAPRPIVVHDGAWVGAFARVGPGLTLGEGSVAALGAVVLADTEPWGVYIGNPAHRVGTREIRDGGIREPDTHLVSELRP